jgi:hypothetical protein
MSRTKAINDYCKGCIYDKLSPGTWREQVELCTSEKSCALWPYRPITVATTNLNRKLRDTDEPNIDALVAGLEDEEDDVPEAMAV